MKLEVKRAIYGDTFTIGHLSIDGVPFCDTLEDIPRELKIDGETCIPAGFYKVIINLSNRFQKIMPLLLNVPGFEGVRIHSGNTAADTHGCILVGVNKSTGTISDSRITFEKLMEILNGAVLANDEITIKVS